MSLIDHSMSLIPFEPTWNTKFSNCEQRDPDFRVMKWKSLSNIGRCTGVSTRQYVQKPGRDEVS